MRPTIPLADRPLAFVDCETTGLDPNIHEIIDIAIIKEWPDGRIHEWASKIAPQVPGAADPYSLWVNKYADAPEQWDGAPKFVDMAPLILARLTDCLIVGHNINFDLNFIRAGCVKAGLGLKLLPRRVLDTYLLVYEHLAHRGLESLSLDAACTMLGISNEGNHTALVDARRCRVLWHALRAKPDAEKAPSN